MATTKSTLSGVAGIYQIRCLANDKVYVGSAVNLEERWRLHRLHLNKNTHHSKHLQNAWKKHGDEAFVFEVLEIVPKIEDLIQIEQIHLDRINPSDRTIGYNISPTAGSSLGIKRGKHTPEHSAKISASLMGNGRTKGHKLTPEHRAKIRANQKPITPEMRAKMSAAAKTRWHQCRTFKQKTFEFD